MTEPSAPTVAWAYVATDDLAHLVRPAWRRTKGTTTWFDTDDGALAAAGIWLQCRTTGLQGHWRLTERPSDAPGRPVRVLATTRADVIRELLRLGRRRQCGHTAADDPNCYPVHFDVRACQFYTWRRFDLPHFDTWRPILDCVELAHVHQNDRPGDPVPKRALVRVRLHRIPSRRKPCREWPGCEEIVPYSYDLRPVQRFVWPAPPPRPADDWTTRPLWAWRVPTEPPTDPIDESGQSTRWDGHQVAYWPTTPSESESSDEFDSDAEWPDDDPGMDELWHRLQEASARIADEADGGEEPLR